MAYQINDIVHYKMQNKRESSGQHGGKDIYELEKVYAALNEHEKAYHFI